MLDFLRDWTKSAEEKQQEALHAYLDGALSPKERQQFEQQLARDERLRGELAQMQTLKQQLTQMPRRRVPRNFTLDPNLYGRPQREPLVQAYPVLRTATALAAFFFVIALAANVFLGSLGGESTQVAMEAVPAADVAEAPAGAEMAAPAPATMVEEQVVEEAAEEEIVVEEGEMMEAAGAEEGIMGIESAEEATAEDEALESAEAEAPLEAEAEERFELARPEATAEAREEPYAAAPVAEPDVTIAADADAPAEKATPTIATFLPIILVFLGLLAALLLVLTWVARRRAQV